VTPEEAARLLRSENPIDADAVQLIVGLLLSAGTRSDAGTGSFRVALAGMAGAGEWAHE
jgi:hypothetical protein